MRTLLARFLKDESGSTAIEYTLIAAGIAIAILTAVNALGGSLAGLFEMQDRCRCRRRLTPHRMQALRVPGSDQTSLSFLTGA